MVKRKKGLSFIFPKHFLWGTTTAAYQVEGNNRESDWWDWEQTGKIPFRSGKAVDHYHKFVEDFAIAKLLHNNAHRLSLEWSRIEPIEGKYNSQEIRHYQEVLQTLKKQGFTTFVTLHHFTSPRWFTARGAFENSQNIQFFEKFVAVCAKEFGNSVDFWLTFNEPMTYTFQAYIEGVWPPGKKNWWSALAVVINLAKAHAAGYRVLHTYNPQVKVGVSYNMIEFKAKTHQVVDVLLAKIISFVENDFFYLLTHNKHDFWGINYYTKYIVSFKRLWKNKEPLDLYGILQDKRRYLGWSMDPGGLDKFLKKVCQKMALPIYITEHGIADSSDQKRGKLLVATLRSLHKAIKNGVDIRGYFHWSLLDNFEWNLGFDPKFGLYKVNRRTLKRTPRQSASLYSKIALDNGLMRSKGKR